MPFTGVHPLAVLPLARTGLPLSALVVGSVVPDFALFVPFRVPFDAVVRSHTPLGLLTIDLPAGLLLWLLWHALLAPAAHAASPGELRARLGEDGLPGVRRRLRRPHLVVAGIVVGAATHVVWDEFTHAGRWGARHVPGWATTFAGLPGWLWAQYLSGVLGLALLAFWARRWWARSSPPSGQEEGGGAALWPWALVAGVTAVVALAAAARHGLPVREAAYAAAVEGVAAGVVVAVLLALGWHARALVTARTAGARVGGATGRGTEGGRR